MIAMCVCVCVCVASVYGLSIDGAYVCVLPVSLDCQVMIAPLVSLTFIYSKQGLKQS